MDMFDIHDSLPTLCMNDFIEKFSKTLPKLISFLHGDELRQHKIWAKLVPYHVPLYGFGKSLGHCIRPDIILTDEGFKICEIDFVPGGRGFILFAIPDQNRRSEYLKTFYDWYKTFKIAKIYYATATQDSYFSETDIFCRTLREGFGTDIWPCNIDEASVKIAGSLLDRLFYRSEMTRQFDFSAVELMTKEPFLDSKMIFALIHDRSMDSTLNKVFDPPEIAFLRSAFPETYALDMLRGENPNFMESVLAEQEQWLVKNSDVETHDSWGARGVVLGARFGRRVFRDAVFTNLSPKNKYIGEHPVLQKFHKSVDFAQMWNAIINSQIASSNGSQILGKAKDQAITLPANKHVFSRIGIYLLVNNLNAQIFVPRLGVITLRQDPLAHGASDALFTAFEIK